MTDKPAIFEDLIDALFRPIIAVFVGLFLGYGAKLAEISHWVVAAGFMMICVLAVGFLLLLDGLFHRVADALLDKIGWGHGIKPARNQVKRRKHWFVRFGWIPFIGLGAAAVYTMPPKVLAWLI